MSVPVHIVAAGAVTAAGLDGPQSFAAVRAGLVGFSRKLLIEPFGQEQTVAAIPAHWSLRPDPGTWLVNMAARAIREAMEGAVRDAGAEPETTALLLTPPESARDHPAYGHVAPSAFLDNVLGAASLVLHPQSRALDGGAAAGLAAIQHAGQILATGDVRHVLLAGVDSLTNPEDLARLAHANRLLGRDNAKGIIPGEAAAVVCLSRTPRPDDPGTAILTSAFARESDTVAGARFSQGRALAKALADASGGGTAEAQIDFVLSNSNLERYAQIEGMIARARFYRTSRPRLPVVYPAMTLGDIGAAGAAFCLALADDAFRRGHAPGRTAMVEIASDSGLRAAAILRGAGAQSSHPAPGADTANQRAAASV